MSDSLSDVLQNLLDEINTIDRSVASMEGKKSTMLETLSKEFGLGSLEEALKEIEVLQVSNEKNKERIESYRKKAEDILNGSV